MEEILKSLEKAVSDVKENNKKIDKLIHRVYKETGIKEFDLKELNKNLFDN